MAEKNKSYYLQKEEIVYPGFFDESILSVWYGSNVTSSETNNLFPKQLMLRLVIKGQDKIERARVPFKFPELCKFVQRIFDNTGINFEKSRNLWDEGKSVSYEVSDKNSKIIIKCYFKKYKNLDSVKKIVYFEINGKTKYGIRLHANDFYYLMIYLKNFCDSFPIVSSNVTMTCNMNRMIECIQENTEVQKQIVKKLDRIEKKITEISNNEIKNEVSEIKKEIKNIPKIDNKIQTNENIQLEKQSLKEEIIPKTNNKNELGLDSPFIGKICNNDSENLYKLIEPYNKKINITSNDNMFSPLEFLFKKSMNEEDYSFLLDNEFYSNELNSLIALKTHFDEIPTNKNYYFFSNPRFRLTKKINPEMSELWEFAKESAVVRGMMFYVIEEHYDKLEMWCSDERKIIAFLHSVNCSLTRNIDKKYIKQFVEELKPTLTKILDSNFPKYIHKKFNSETNGQRINFDYDKVMEYTLMELRCDYKKDESFVDSDYKDFYEKIFKWALYKVNPEKIECNTLDDVKYNYFRYVKKASEIEEEKKSLSENKKGIPT